MKQVSDPPPPVVPTLVESVSPTSPQHEASELVEPTSPSQLYHFRQHSQQYHRVVSPYGGTPLSPSSHRAQLRQNCFDLKPFTVKQHLLTSANCDRNSRYTRPQSASARMPWPPGCRTSTGSAKAAASSRLIPDVPREKRHWIGFECPASLATLMKRKQLQHGRITREVARCHDGKAKVRQLQ